MFPHKCWLLSFLLGSLQGHLGQHRKFYMSGQPSRASLLEHLLCHRGRSQYPHVQCIVGPSGAQRIVYSVFSIQCIVYCVSSAHCVTLYTLYTIQCLWRAGADNGFPRLTWWRAAASPPAHSDHLRLDLTGAEDHHMMMPILIMTMHIEAAADADDDDDDAQGSDRSGGPQLKVFLLPNSQTASDDEMMKMKILMKRRKKKMMMMMMMCARATSRLSLRQCCFYGQDFHYYCTTIIINSFLF